MFSTEGQRHHEKYNDIEKNPKMVSLKLLAREREKIPSNRKAMLGYLKLLSQL